MHSRSTSAHRRRPRPAGGDPGDGPAARRGHHGARRPPGRARRPLRHGRRGHRSPRRAVGIRVAADPERRGHLPRPSRSTPRRRSDDARRHASASGCPTAQERVPNPPLPRPGRRSTAGSSTPSPPRSARLARAGRRPTGGRTLPGFARSDPPHLRWGTGGFAAHPSFRRPRRPPCPYRRSTSTSAARRPVLASATTSALVVLDAAEGADAVDVRSRRSTAPPSGTRPGCEIAPNPRRPRRAPRVHVRLLVRARGGSRTSVVANTADAPASDARDPRRRRPPPTVQLRSASGPLRASGTVASGEIAVGPEWAELQVGRASGDVQHGSAAGGAVGRPRRPASCHRLGARRPAR